MHRTRPVSYQQIKNDKTSPKRKNKKKETIGSKNWNNKRHSFKKNFFLFLSLFWLIPTIGFPTEQKRRLF